MNDLARVLEDLKAFVAEREWEQFHDPKNLAMAVVSEAGELAAEYWWIESREADEWSRDPTNRRQVEAEAADVGIALLLFCDRVGFSLLDAIASKMAVNRSNYPAHLSRGRRERPKL